MHSHINSLWWSWRGSTQISLWGNKPWGAQLANSLQLPNLEIHHRLRHWLHSLRLLPASKQAGLLEQAIAAWCRTHLKGNHSFFNFYIASISREREKERENLKLQGPMPYEASRLALSLLKEKLKKMDKLNYSHYWK